MICNCLNVDIVLICTRKYVQSHSLLEALLLEQNNDKWHESLFVVRAFNAPRLNSCNEGAFVYAEQNVGGLRLLLSRHLVSVKACSWTLVLVS